MTISNLANVAVKTVKQLHIVIDPQKHVKPLVRKPYDAETMGRFDANAAFGPQETSPFLTKVLGDRGERYIQFTGHAFGQETLEQVTTELGKYANHGIRMGGEFWKFFYGSYTDKGSMFMIPSKSAIKSPDDIGLHFIDPAKAPKYAKRLFAPHQYCAFGKILDIEETVDGHVVLFELESGYKGYWRNVELEKMPSDLHRSCCDGGGLAKPEFLLEIGVKVRNINNYGCKPTVAGPVGTGKGFMHARKGLAFDIVTYGAKKALVYDDFFFGILGALKPGDKFKSDNQSMANFDESANDFALEAAQDFMESLSEKLADKDSIRGMLMSNLKNVNKVDGDPTSTEGWRLINAVEVGMDIEMEPSLVRARNSYFMSEVMQLDRGRIPFDKYGMRCDIMTDPHMFDEHGDVHPDRSIIKKGTCVAMDVPMGPVVTSRQPNGHAQERWDCMNVRMRQFDCYEGERRIIYGPHDLIENLSAKNGEDLDDTERVIFEPRMVKHIREQSYPVTQKMTVMNAKRHTLGRYYNTVSRSLENLSTASFTAKDFNDAMERARTMRMKLGQVVNNITLDTLLSGKHKAHMIAYLTDLIMKEQDKDVKVFLLEKREWLANREDYQLRDIATNLEAVIDFCVQGKGDPKQFNPMMKQVLEMNANTQVFPLQMAKKGTGFMGQGKISPKKKLGEDYILAPSLMCQAMLDVEAERELFMNDLRAQEWACITPVPTAVDEEFTPSSDMSLKARAIQKWFNTKVVAAMSLPREQSRVAYNQVLYGTFSEDRKTLIEDGLVQMLDNESNGDAYDAMYIAVEMKRLVHRNQDMKYDDNNNVRSVPDGVFGNNVVFGHYLKALDHCNLTGKYIQVELDQVSISRKVRTQIFDVVVTDGTVTRKHDSFYVGTVEATNGEYRLMNGMLEIRRPDITITTDYQDAENIQEGGYMPKAVDFDIN